jgi:enoyl-CoA hydratase/carnithine racemase
MDYQNIHVEEKAEGIVVITLKRPEKRNAISIMMRQEISHCLEDLKASSRIGGVVFTGAGSTFSAGFDLDEFTQTERFGELFESSTKYHRNLWYFPVPTIAAVNGPAMGGGFDLATFCDIRICSQNAVFGHPEIKFGAPPLFTPLRWIIGDGLARDLCLTGRRIDALEAYRIGLVSEVVEADLLERAVAIGRSILEAPLGSLRFVKRYLVNNANRGFEESFGIEHDQAFQEIILI